MQAGVFFAELAFTSTLNVCVQVEFLLKNGPCELSDMIFNDLLIGALVQIVLALIKGGYKIMSKKFRKARSDRQKLSMDNITRDEAKIIEWRI